MLTKEEQKKVIDLVCQTKTLIDQELEHAKITVKGAADYVTNVDFAVQNFLKRELEELFPEILLIAEEKENLNLDAKKRYWILDPIDGTTNLIHHFGMSAVSLGLYEDGEITFGVVYNPFHEELFTGVKGEGAFLNGEKIHVSEIAELKDAVIGYGSSPYEKENAKESFSLFYRLFINCADFRRMGAAALDLCYVACGRQEGFFEKNLKPWDYAAGSVILTEAGGVITDWKGEKLPYLRNSEVFCCSKKIEKELRKLF